MNTGKFKPLFYYVLVVSATLCSAIFFNQLSDHSYNIRESIDGGGIVLFFAIILLGELMAYLIFKFFNKLIGYLNNFYVALLASVFSPAILIVTLMFIHQH
jgi:hypothetical protein